MTTEEMLEEEIRSTVKLLHDAKPGSEDFTGYLNKVKTLCDLKNDSDKTKSQADIARKDRWWKTATEVVLKTGEWGLFVFLLRVLMIYEKNGNILMSMAARSFFKRMKL